MIVDLTSLLALPPEERKEIAEKLWSSLSPTNDIDREDEAIPDLLEKRWQGIKEGKTQMYSSEQIKELVSLRRNKK